MTNELLSQILISAASVLAPFPMALLLYLIIWGGEHYYLEREYLFSFAVKILLLVIILFGVYLLVSGKLEINFKGW